MSGLENCSRTKDEEDSEERTYDVASSSNDTNNPEQDYQEYKIKKELQIIDYNSADDVSKEKNQSKDGGSWQCLSELPSIQTMTAFLLNTCHNYRQTMKAVLSGRHSNHEDVGKCNGDTEITNNTIKIQNDENQNESENVTEVSAPVTETEKDESGPSKEISVAPVTRKRGRPPKAGSSKRFKRIRYTMREMYQGKLQNLIVSRGRRRSDSEDDGEFMYH